MWWRLRVGVPVEPQPGADRAAWRPSTRLRLAQPARQPNRRPSAPLRRRGAARDRRRRGRRARRGSPHLVACRSLVPVGDRWHRRAQTRDLSSTAQPRIVNSTLGDFHDATTNNTSESRYPVSEANFVLQDARRVERAHRRPTSTGLAPVQAPCCRPRSTERPRDPRAALELRRACSLGCVSSRPEVAIPRSRPTLQSGGPSEPLRAERTSPARRRPARERRSRRRPRGCG